MVFKTDLCEVSLLTLTLGNILGCGLDSFKLNECVSFSEASLTVKFSSHGEKQEPVVLLWQEYVIKVRTTFQFNGFLLGTVKVALTLLFVTRKYTRILQ